MSNHVVRRFIGAGLVGLSALGLAACGGKPSEGDIKDKLVEIYSSKQVGLDKDKAEKLAECMAPKMEDKVSEDGLKKIMDIDVNDVKDGADPVNDISKADDEAMNSIGQECAGQIGM